MSKSNETVNGVAAIIAALVAQPFAVGWLYAVSRMARRFESAPA